MFRQIFSNIPDVTKNLLLTYGPKVPGVLGPRQCDQDIRPRQCDHDEDNGGVELVFPSLFIIFLLEEEGGGGREEEEDVGRMRDDEA